MLVQLLPPNPPSSNYVPSYGCHCGMLRFKKQTEGSLHEEQTRCLSGLTEALHVKNSSQCWQNRSWSCNLSRGSPDTSRSVKPCGRTCAESSGLGVRLFLPATGQIATGVSKDCPEKKRVPWSQLKARCRKCLWRSGRLFLASQNSHFPTDTECV